MDHCTLLARTRHPTNLYEAYSVARFEWPTWLLIIAVYGGWGLCLRHYHTLGHLPAGTLLVLIGALHGSLQHELLHGHPTRSALLNGALGYVPIVLLFPYYIYRREHMTHHNNAILTLPGIDPESCYVSQKTWMASGVCMRAYYRFRMTLLGRFLCGPAHTAVSLSGTLLRDMVSGSPLQRVAWLSHLSLAGLVLYWINAYFQIPLWHYLLIAYLANSLTMVRSFFEH